MDYILNISLSIVELTNIILCYSQVLQMKVTKNKFRIVIGYICIMLSNLLNVYCKINIPIIIINLFLTFVIACFVIEGKVINILKLYPCAYMVESVVCLASSYLYATVVDIPQISTEMKLELSIFLNSVFWIIMVLQMIFTKISSRPERQYIFDNSIYVALTVGSISFLFILSAISSFANNFDIPYNQTNFLGLLLCGVCIIFYILFFWLARSVHRNEAYQHEKNMLSIYMDEQDKYIKLVIDKDNDIRSFRHDIKARMDVLDGYLMRQEYDSAHKYISKINEHYDNTRIDKYTGDIALDAIITQRKKQMDEQGIEFVWDGSDLEVPKEKEIYDLCTLITNILNNAIEACTSIHSEDKRIEMKMRINGEKIYFFERNKIIEKVDFDDDNNPITKKEDKRNHGYGSKNIRNVVEKYNGVLVYNVKDEYFELEINI